MDYHKPVMAEEVLAHLKVEKGNLYIDATLGDGGHTLEILRRGGNVLGMDYDPVSLKRATQRIESADIKIDGGAKFHSVLGNFRDIDSIARKSGFSEVHGILFDLGYSSTQLESQNIGLSFTFDQPLDMRLSNDVNVKALDLLNFLSEKDLTKLIYENSGEIYAKKIAKAVVMARKLKKIQTTAQLVEIIKSVTPSDYEKGRIHPATRTFQALRMVVNDEMRNLEISLPRAARLLLPGGRLVVISFQSIEDSSVKKLGLSAQLNIKPVTEKPVVPDDNEIATNPRSRSAKMRVFEKC